MKTPSLVPKSDFIGLDRHIHLAAGGQTPNLVSHLDVLHRFALTKGTGLKGQEENTTMRARAATAAPTCWVAILMTSVSRRVSPMPWGC